MSELYKIDRKYLWNTDKNKKYAQKTLDFSSDCDIIVYRNKK